MPEPPLSPPLPRAPPVSPPFLASIIDSSSGDSSGSGESGDSGSGDSGVVDGKTYGDRRLESESPDSAATQRRQLDGPYHNDCFNADGTGTPLGGMMASYVGLFASFYSQTYTPPEVTDDDLRSGVSLNTTITGPSDCGCTPTIDVGLYSFPPSTPPPYPPSPPHPHIPPSLPSGVDCSCPSSTSSALSTSELVGFLEALGPVATSSSCDSYPVCSIEQISMAVRTGRLLVSHIEGLTAYVAGSNDTAAMDECYNMLARVCTCADTCWENTAPSQVVTRELDNSILFSFSEMMVPLQVSGTRASTISFAVNQTSATLAGTSYASVAVSNAALPWTAMDSARTYMAVGPSANTASLHLNLSVTPSGGEVVSITSFATQFIGSHGGLASPTSFNSTLYDRVAPTFTAAMAASSLEYQVVALMQNWGQMTVMVTFSEPCFGSGPNGSFVDSDWHTTINEVDYSLDEFNISATITIQEWVVSNRRLLSESDAFAATQQTGEGVTQLALQVGLAVSGPWETENGVVPTASVYFVGPTAQSVTDADGNYLVVDPYAPPVTFVAPLDIQSCSVRNRVCTDAPYVCTCVDDSPRPPPFTLPPPPPPLYPPSPSPYLPGMAPPGYPAVEEGITTEDDPVTMIIIPAVVGVLLIPLLVVAFLYCLKMRRLKKKKALEEKLKKLEELRQHLLQHDAGDESEVLELLNEALVTSEQKKVPLGKAMEEVVEEHDWEGGGIFDFQGNKGGKGDKLSAALIAGNILTEQMLGRAAASDREALEVLDMVLHTASSKKLKRGWDGGGGIRLRPPKLGAPGEPAFTELRPVIDADDIPEDLLLAAGEMGADMDELQDMLNEMQGNIDKKLILPGVVAGALMAEYMLRNPDSPPATEHEQVELLGMLLLGRVVHQRKINEGIDGGGGVRCRPPPLRPPGWVAPEEDPEPELPVTSEGGGVKVTPPKLLPFDPRQEGEFIGAKDLTELAKVSLDSRVKPLRDGDLGGGVKVRPPMLRPPGAEHHKKPLAATNEESELASGPSSWDGGGGVCVHPPKLMNAEGGEFVFDDHGGFHAAEAAASEVGKENAQLSFGPAGDLQRAKSAQELHEIALESVNQILGVGDQGGGVRLPPPKLHAPPKEWESLGTMMENTGAARLQGGRHDHMDVLADAGNDMFLDALIAEPTGEYEKSLFADAEPGEQQKDGVQLAEAADDANAGEKSETHDHELEAHELGEGMEAGGGVRLPPPKLVPVGGWTHAAQAEEAAFLQAMGADTAVIAEAVNISGMAVKDDKDFSVQLAENEVQPEDIVHATLHALEEVEMDTGAEAGGGVRLPPPKLMPIGVESKQAMEEAADFMHNFAPEPQIETVSEAELIKAAKKAAAIEAQQARKAAMEREVEMERPPNLQQLKRRSTQELLAVKSDAAAVRGASPERRGPSQIERLSSGGSTLNLTTSKRELIQQPTRRARPPRPGGPPRAKVLKSSNEEPLEGWNGGGGVRIAPGLLNLVKGPKDPRAPRAEASAPATGEGDEGTAPPSPPPSPPSADYYASKKGKVHHAADFMPDLSKPIETWVEVDSDDEAFEEMYDTPHGVPPGLLRTLAAEDYRSRGRGDGLKLAKELVNQYARAHGKFAIADGDGVAQGVQTPMVRKKVVKKSLKDAVGYHHAGLKMLQTTMHKQDGGAGSQSLNDHLSQAIAELEAEIAGVETGLCVCCEKKKKRPPEYQPPVSLGKKQRTKVAPSSIDEPLKSDGFAGNLNTSPPALSSTRTHTAGTMARASTGGVQTRMPAPADGGSRSRMPAPTDGGSRSRMPAPAVTDAQMEAGIARLQSPRGSQTRMPAPIDGAYDLSASARTLAPAMIEEAVSRASRSDGGVTRQPTFAAQPVFERTPTFAAAGQPSLERTSSHRAAPTLATQGSVRNSSGSSRRIAPMLRSPDRAGASREPSRARLLDSVMGEDD